MTERINQIIDQTARLSVRRKTAHCPGAWTIQPISSLDALISLTNEIIELNYSDNLALDTAGVWLLYRIARERQDVHSRPIGLRQEFDALQCRLSQRLEFCLNATQ